MPAAKPIKVNIAKPLMQTCGVGEVGYFRYFDDFEAAAKSPTIEELVVDKKVAGCGWVISSFTPGMPVYKDAYKQMCERFGEPIFQSEVRNNERTNHKFFFCIWDTKGTV